jgi:hypothetical protein
MESEPHVFVRRNAPETTGTGLLARGERELATEMSSEDETKERVRFLSTADQGQFLEGSFNPSTNDIRFQDEQVLQAASLDKDPFKKPRGGPSKEWLEALENLEPRTLSVPEPHEQEAAVDEILTTLETEPPEPSPELVA